MLRHLLLCKDWQLAGNKTAAAGHSSKMQDSKLGLAYKCSLNSACSFELYPKGTV